MLCPSRSTWVRFATPTKDIGTDPDRFPLLFQSDYTLRHWPRRHLAYWRIISSFVPSQMALCCAQRGHCSAPDGHPPDTLGKIGILVSFRKSNGERLICLRRADITETYDQRQLTADDFLFRRQGAQLPMTPTTFTYRFKLILKKNGLPQELNVHSLRHPYVKHTTKKYNSEKQKTQATKIVDLIAWGFCFCFVCYSKRSWTL